jgi:hypothetical protein
MARHCVSGKQKDCTGCEKFNFAHVVHMVPIQPTTVTTFVLQWHSSFAAPKDLIEPHERGQAASASPNVSANSDRRYSKESARKRQDRMSAQQWLSVWLIVPHF